jgi:hypothetical protein
VFLLEYKEKRFIHRLHRWTQIEEAERRKIHHKDSKTPRRREKGNHRDTEGTEDKDEGGIEERREEVIHRYRRWTQTEETERRRVHHQDSKAPRRKEKGNHRDTEATEKKNHCLLCDLCVSVVKILGFLLMCRR